MKILGIDPGYDRLGIAILERKKSASELSFSDCLTTDKKLIFAERLLELGNALEKIIIEFRPELLALETLFFAKNKKTAMLVAETRGLILYLAAKHHLRVYEISPASVKLTTTGYGRADKAQIIAMLPKLLKIDKTIKHDDEFDAIAIALTALSTVSLN
ncbi:crossover junction endodeoxyribonuclease RuvC [Candidatus Nomurabacteria bacterium]|nr:crossover junction endodeoxyribonuclease RuvC [Candidatus Nomurabacteria bacterium]